MRKFRILRITALAYRHLINSLYENNIDLGEKTYNEQLNVIISKKAVFSNGISLGLESLGHEVIEIICDVPPLQFAWARENNYDINGEDDWISKISLAQVV